jgi:ankyrin repeat protein
MDQPEELKSDRPLKWSPGRGTDVWAMFRAAMAGDVQTIRWLLQQDPSLARCHYHYRKPLYFAVRENRLEVVRLLLDHDPDPTGLAVNDSLIEIAQDRGYAEMEKLLETKLSDVHGASSRGEPVAAAIRAGDLNQVRALLDASPDLVKAGDTRGNQPIHWVVMTRQPAAFIEELLKRGADINAQRTDGARPIQLTNGDYHHRGWRDVPKDHPITPRMVLDHLRSRGAECDICTAAHVGDSDRVRQLLDADPTLANRPSDYVTYYACSGTPLRNAAAAGHLAIVKLLLERGADPNLPEESIAPQGHALYSAATNGHFEVAKLLLEHGAYPNAEVESSADILSRVLANKDQKMLELLCSHGAARGVHLLAHDNDLETAAAVFAANTALANDPEALGSAGSEEFVRLMLRYQPDLARRVTVVKSRELTELLFAHGMDPSRPNWLGITSLHEIAQRGNIEAAGLFLDHGADLHARDEDICSTPLGWAAKFGRLEMVRFLLQRGATPNRPDDPPWATPLAWAERREHPEIAKLLEQHTGRGGVK